MVSKPKVLTFSPGVKGNKSQGQSYPLPHKQATEFVYVGWNNHDGDAAWAPKRV